MAPSKPIKTSDTKQFSTNAATTMNFTKSPIHTKNKLNRSSLKTGLVKKKYTDDYVLFLQGCQAGFVVAWIVNYRTLEQPFINPQNLSHELYDIELEGDGYQFFGLVNRKGRDGKTPMQQFSKKSSYDCKQFVFLLSEDTNTPQNRSIISQKLIKHVNYNVSSGHICTVKDKVIASCDLTHLNQSLKHLSECFLDCDVKKMMMFALNEANLNYLSNCNNLMKKYWSDTAYGKNSMSVENIHLLYIAGYQEGVIVAWIKNNQMHEEAGDISPLYMVFNKGYEKLQKEGISCSIVNRKGSNGTTPMEQFSLKGNYTWKQFLIVVEEFKNNSQTRLAIANKLTEHLNNVSHTVDKIYGFEYEIKFAKDVTSTTLPPITDALLDEDVEDIMLGIYSSPESDASAEYAYLKGFWTSIECKKKLEKLITDAE